MIDALGQRLVIAEKYSQVEPIFAKMPGYLSTIDATDQEKQEFLKGFTKDLPKSLAARKSLYALERGWLTSSIDLYNFALSHRSSYTYSSGNVVFRSAANLAVFNDKLNKSRELQFQFLRAYSTSRNSQDAALAQMGLQRSDIGLDNPK